MLGRVGSWFGSAAFRVRGKGRKFWKKFALHWGIAAILIFIGLCLGGWLGEQQYWISARYRIYERQTRNLVHPAYNRRTVLLMIGDEEHWKGKELAGRTPTNRKYLAKLLRAVGAASPEVVALDFRLRAPTPDGTPVSYKDYDEEIRDFIEAVKDVTARSTTVVLPKSLGEDEGGYILESDIYDGKLATGGKVRTGYIELDDDLRKVPLDLELKGGGALDSFSLAIVRAAEGTPPLPSHDNNSMPFGGFMRPAEFKQVTPSEVLHMAEAVRAALAHGTPPSEIPAADKAVLESLAHKIVIVGANWHSLAYNRGPWVDSFDTPVGEMAGAYVHANYVNLLMTSGVNAPLHEEMNKGIELLFSLAVALLFYLPFRALWKFLAFFALAPILFFISYFFWQNLGFYFDFFIPMVLLFVHFLIEHWLHLREELAELRAQVAQPATPFEPVTV